CASQAGAGPNVRVSIDASGEGSGLIAHAYTACLRNTPGVQVVPQVVPLGEPADAEIQIVSISMTNKAGQETGYAWATNVIAPDTNVELRGIHLTTIGRSRQGVFDEVASEVLDLDRDVFISLRNGPK